MFRTLSRCSGTKRYNLSAVSSAPGSETTSKILNSKPITTSITNSNKPEPVDLLLAALVSCESATAHYVARKLKPPITLGKLSFHVIAERDPIGALHLPIDQPPPTPSRLTKVDGSVYVDSCTVASDEQLNALSKITHVRCPVANMMILSGCSVNLSFVRRSFSTTTSTKEAAERDFTNPIPTSTMSSTYETKLQTLLSDMDTTQYTIHTTTNQFGKIIVKCSPTDGEKALLNSFGVVSPPMTAQWAQLHGEGTLGGKYAPKKSQARFQVSLVKGKVEETAGDKASVLVAFQDRFIDRIEAICKEIAMHIYNDPTLCAEKKKSGWSAAKQAVAIMKKVDAKTLTNDDPDVKRMHVTWFLNSMNQVVKREGEDASLTVKKFVFGRLNWKDPPNSEVLQRMPITDVRGKVLNEENEERCIGNGDLISAYFKLDPYILPNGTFGVAFSLKSVQKIKAGRMTGGKRKADISRSAIDFGWGSLETWNKFHERNDSIDWFTNDDPAFLEIIAQRVAQLTSNSTSSPPKVLHVGAGTSSLSEVLERKLPDHEVTHTDLSPVAVELLRARLPASTIVVSDITNMAENFQHGSFDVIVDKGVIDLLHHSAHSESGGGAISNSLKCISKLLAPDGVYLQITNDAVEARENLFLKHDSNNSFDVARMAQSEIETDDGFTINIIAIRKKKVGI